jgi:FkbM family methyltransferase
MDYPQCGKRTKSEAARQVLKRVIASMGYDLRRAPREPFPYVKRFQTRSFAFDFWIADQIGKLWYTQEILDSNPEFPALLGLLQRGDRVLEIGSHHGFFAMLMACAVGPSGYVLGLEAVPFNAMVAQSQISLNGLGPVCSIRNLAGSDVPGTVPIHNSAYGHVTLAKSWDTVSVRAETGDQMDLELGPFNVLKIDVEGFEGKVLAGCTRLLSRRPKLAIEVHTPFLGVYGTSVGEIFSAIDAPSYEGVLIGRRNREYSEPIPFNPSGVPKSHFNIILSPRDDGENA